jgi:hypothetical protein
MVTDALWRAVRLPLVDTFPPRLQASFSAILQKNQDEDMTDTQLTRNAGGMGR